MSSSRTNGTPLSGAFSVVPQTTHPAPAPRAQPRQFIPPSLFKFIPPSLDIQSHTPRSNFKFPGPRQIRYGTKVSGVPMAQLLSRSGRPANLEVLHRMIPDFEDHTILETGLRDVELKICWPGYQHLRFSRTIFLDPRRGRGVTCKGELAMKVAEAYYEFLMYAPCYQPREAVAGSPRPLVITPNGPFTIDNLALTLLTHVDRGVFEALVEYIPPPPVVGYYIPGLLLDVPQQVYSSCCPVVATPRLNVPDAYTLHNHPAMVGPHSASSHAQHAHQGASSSRPQSFFVAEGDGRLWPAQW